MRGIAYLVVVSLCSAASVSAQSAETGEESLDQEARGLFIAGQSAFDGGRYREALGYFQRAYDLSQKPELLYNVGTTADRLRMDDEALRAFEAFLEAVPNHPRRVEVEARVRAIREARAAETSPPAGEPSTGSPVAADGGGEPEPARPPAASDGVPPPGEVPPVTEPDSGAQGGLSTGTIVGAASVGALGLGGLVAATVGIAGSGSCIDRTTAGVCVETDETNWAAVGIYGGLGLAALVGAVVWLVMGGNDESTEEPAVAIGAGSVRWSF